MDGAQEIEWRQIEWRRAARCDTGACVEVAHLDEVYLIRNSHDPDGPTLSFTGPEWQAFTVGVRAGDFDPPD